MNFWAVIPAAGIGARMGAAIPKQYLPLRGKTVFECTLERLVSHPRICGAVVAIAEGDGLWAEIDARGAYEVMTANGGPERAHSVMNALQRLAGTARGDDWVLVHDAVRPCVRHSDIDRLMDTLSDHPVGGLLGIAVTDTVKRTDPGGNIVETVPRAGLWRAATPQMFRLGALSEVLRAAIEARRTVTDEAEAMELAGLPPRVVAGEPDNIKITHPGDLALAELFLRQQDAAP